MGRTEIEFELDGFKIGRLKVRIKADKEDAPRISGEIGKLMNFMQPPANLIDEPVRKQIPSTIVPSNIVSNGGRGRSNRRSKSANNGAAATSAVDWQHDPSKWGMPKQEWKAGNKVLWVLYVVKNELGITELTASVIAEVFSTKFRQFGALRKTSMPSILGSLKTSALIMDDTTKDPNTWYLSDQGIKSAEQLVQDAKILFAA
ncbi:MAG TPA: hypothetical protein VGG44_00840 [Tepidisphaeraceae bacterium]